MNTRTSIAFIGTTAMVIMLGCSMPQIATSVAAAPAESSAPPVIVFHSVPLERLAPPLEPPPAFCKLGTSCLALDPRPFEACLLSTKDCRDKVVEPLLVEQQGVAAPPVAIETAH
jgi:hypothetical protein